MGPVGAEVEIDLPRSRVFEAISDLSLRPSFTDHFISDFRLTRIEPAGLGAGARFRFTPRPRRFWMDTTIVEVEAPHRVVERGRGGRANRIPSTTVWELLEGAGSRTKVRVSFRTEPSNPLDRLVEALTATSLTQERGWREALGRLRDQLESGDVEEARVTVAGGSPLPTGIP
jgi:uncharacterized protein YndB with AHSA1/START domain